MALQVCTSKPHTQLRLETPQNPRDQSGISLIFAESTLLGGEKKKFLQYAALEKSLPQQPAQLGGPAHICVPSCLCSVAAREAQPRASSQHRDTTGTSGGSAGWGWQERPHCWMRERLLAPRKCVSVWHRSMGSQVQVLCSTPAQGGTQGTCQAGGDPQGSSSGHPRVTSPASERFPDAPGALAGSGKPTPLPAGHLPPWESCSQPTPCTPCRDSPCILDFGCPPTLSCAGCSHSQPH